jgi:hypothetical protein
MKRIIKTAALLVVGIFIAADINAQSFLTSGLVAYYPFNGNANDASGNGNHATANGIYSYGTNSSTPYHHFIQTVGDHSPTYVNGGYVSFPNLAGIVSNSITVSLWVKLLDSIPDDYPVFFGMNNAGQRYFGIDCYQGFTIADSSGVTRIPVITTNISGIWKHFVIAYQPGSMTAFIDGQLVGQTNVTVSGLPLSSGALGWHQWLNGTAARSSWQYANVRIFNRALATNEVAHLHTVESTEFSLPYLNLAIALKLSLQSPSNVVGTVATTANPTQVKLVSKDLLSMLAMDEHLNGSWPSNSFPAKATLALAGHSFVVLNGTNVLLNVSDIMSLEYGEPQVTSGKRNTVTGLAGSSAQKLALANIVFDDTFINGGNNLHFCLYGVLKLTTTDTAPVNGVYTETQTIGKATVVGDGFLNDVPFTCTGTLSATGKSLLQL